MKPEAVRPPITNGVKFNRNMRYMVNTVTGVIFPYRPGLEQKMNMEFYVPPQFMPPETVVNDSGDTAADLIADEENKAPAIASAGKKLMDELGKRATAPTPTKKVITAP